MVCPVCILPVVGAMGAAGSGKAANNSRSKWLRMFMWILTFGLTMLSVYVFWNRKKLKTNCGSCKIT